MRHPTSRELSARRLVVSRLRAYCEQPDAPRGVDAGGITVAGGPGANATAEPGEASDSPRTFAKPLPPTLRRLLDVTKARERNYHEMVAARLGPSEEHEKRVADWCVAVDVFHEALMEHEAEIVARDRREHFRNLLEATK